MAIRFEFFFRLGKRVIGFASSTILLMALSLVAIPVMVRASGLDAWSYIALGQGIGTMFAALILWDWGVVGPTRIALYQESDRRREYLLSMFARFPLIVGALPAMALLSYVVSKAHVLETFAGTAFSASIGLTSVWFFAGIQSPLLYLVYETVPRCVATLISIAAMLWLDAQAWQGILIQTGGMLIGVLVAASRILAGGGFGRGSLRPFSMKWVFGSLWARRAGLSRTLMYNGYLAAPIAIVGYFTPAVLPEFAIYDRIVRQVTGAMQPVVAALQGILPHYVGPGRRNGQITAACVFLGGLIAIAIRPIIDPLVTYFSAGEVRGSAMEYWLVASIIGAGLLDLLLAISIMPILGVVKQSGWVTFASILFGIPAIFIGANAVGVVGALVGLLAGVLVRDALQLIVIRGTLMPKRST
ncbi:hypothetical protein [Mycolicibacterium monacense]|uniref:hypothetical protein n=1 Tax=Mycolicibacterium monacense TaxID=85693 RepID=UPI000ACD2226|nr:hypothetical protein [Mycolicibacterium monacense]